ncbi:MRC1 domain-containing protein [Mycena venus]|uniref:MRC1 domain-containing protein n=1 Tax=Mycena venus TaxID=2733690 RepID=A0A8H7CYY6_9AGAR|nr:MRC1 domain-containing protein [Mycena venus]
MVNPDEDGEEEGEDAENEAPVPVKSRGLRRSTRPILDSDSENDENTAPLPGSASLALPFQDDSDENLVSPIDLAGVAAHRGSVSSMDERTEDEGDKENNTHLMYDKSEDKENKAVPRHPFGPRPGIGRQGSLFGLEEGIQRGLSMSPGIHEPMSDDENDENNMSGDRRRPLQNLHEDPFLAVEARLKQASPFQLDSPESTLRPSLDPAARIDAKGFSQFSDDESVAFKGAPLQPGFSDLFESGTEPKRPSGLSASFSEKSETGLFALRAKNTTLGLTQDVDLQPAFDVGDHLKRQADAVFEKEQEFLWEAANRKQETDKQELYVNDHGFLTQTRPDGEEAEIYQPSSPPATLVSTQKSGLLDPQSVLRRPLRTLSLTESEFDAPSRSPMRRLAKRTRTPSPRSNRSSPSPIAAIRTKNALDLLRRESLRESRPKRKLEKSEFVAEEAQESDDDEMMAFGGRTQDDGEEEEGEDMDKTLETLVDDKEMDEATVAADRVLEKFQEHAHEDDLANEKLQQAVVQGELRKKRRNRGLGLDDSDEEDSEDEMRARKMRRGLHEPKIAEHVGKLANDPATRAFYNAYRADLDPGDNAEFAHLQETQPPVGEDAEMGSDDEGERGIITQTELTERMRAMARQEQKEPELDPHDVSWMDGDGDSDGETKVKQISRRREARNNNPLEAGVERERERMHQWAKQEGRSRNVGTGRASGRNAVTGQNARAKAGGGSLRAGAQVAGKPTEVRRSLGVKPSVLAVVASDRSARFE